MDHLISREKELEVDLESCGTASEDERTKDHSLANREAKTTFSRVWSGLLRFDGLGKSECAVSSCSSMSSFGDLEGETIELLIDKNPEESLEHMAPVEKNCTEEKRKNKNSRKPPKPPRPPKGPSLDAADQKLVREITELAMRKRARNKRIKALKKMKAAKSSSGSISAMIITFLFCLVIIFQGIGSRSALRGISEGSPAPAVGTDAGFISVQFHKQFSTNERYEANLNSSPNLAAEKASGSGARIEARNFAR